MKNLWAVVWGVTMGWTIVARAAGLADVVRGVDATVLSAESKPAGMVRAAQRELFLEAGAREAGAFGKVASRAEWEGFAGTRVKALRESLGEMPAEAGVVRVMVTGMIEGEGYRVEKLVYASRPGLVVTANLYLPAAKPREGMPGFVLSHSHHAPKSQGELQDMGINWARGGCAVLVPDHLGHGERRQHPFASSADFAGPFKAGRQDYYFRYNTALQLYVAGESLMGWMVWDLMRGVDVLLEHAKADPKRIIMVGGVAGGGDPAGVAAALDGRIACVVPFNFGGPQPEDFPLPADAERAFPYFGEGYWETTRGLRNGARDGFAHWTVAASVAPRRLIVGHEFQWEKEKDPTWPRIERVFSFYGEPSERLAVAQGRGMLKGKEPESSHCGNVGPLHRAGVYPALQKWFGIAPPDRENQKRHKAEELACLTPAALEALGARKMHDVAAELAAGRAKAARERMARMGAEERVTWLREEWAKALGRPGDLDPPANVNVEMVGDVGPDGVTVERFEFATEAGITVPVIRLSRGGGDAKKSPAVVMFAQAGKQRLLRERPAAIAEMLAGGVVVYLADLRGTGETAAGTNRGRTSEATSVSQGAWILGRTMLGGQLRDLRSVLRWVRGSGAPVAVWGDSLTPANPADRALDVPLDAEGRRDVGEPGAGLLAMLAALYEPGVRAAYSRGGLASYQSILAGQFLYVPHDAVVPGVMGVGDIEGVEEVVKDRLRAEGRVDGMNRAVGAAGDEVAGARWVVGRLVK